MPSSYHEETYVNASGTTITDRVNYNPLQFQIQIYLAVAVFCIAIYYGWYCIKT